MCDPPHNWIDLFWMCLDLKTVYNFCQLFFNCLWKKFTMKKINSSIQLQIVHFKRNYNKRKWKISKFDNTMFVRNIIFIFQIYFHILTERLRTCLSRGWKSSWFKNESLLTCCFGFNLALQYIFPKKSS